MNRNIYYTYILTNWNTRVMYVGVTSDLARRLYEHEHGLFDGFTRKYKVHKLVYYEETGEIESAILREKQLKSWSRAKKDQLVETINPKWEDLRTRWR